MFEPYVLAAAVYIGGAWKPEEPGSWPVKADWVSGDWVVAMV